MMKERKFCISQFSLFNFKDQWGWKSSVSVLSGGEDPAVRLLRVGGALQSHQRGRGSQWEQSSGWSVSKNLWLICQSGFLQEISHIKVELRGQRVVIRYCSQSRSEPATENRQWLEGGAGSLPCTASPAAVLSRLDTSIGSGVYRGKAVFDFH